MNTAPFLYQTTLGGFAKVYVTHNVWCDSSSSSLYKGNLALHVQDHADDVLARRVQLEQHIGKPIQWLNQVHGVTVHDCGVPEHSPTQLAPMADAAVATSSNIALAVMTADCLPVVFVARNNSDQQAIAVAHAGWRGLAAGVLTHTVQALHRAVPNACIHAHFGPCIGVSRFEVGAEVLAVFCALDSQHETYFTTKPSSTHINKYLCDLEGLARHALGRLGVVHVSGGGWCTVSDMRLASYRRAPVTGRFATLITWP